MWRDIVWMTAFSLQKFFFPEPIVFKRAYCHQYPHCFARASFVSGISEKIVISSTRSTLCFLLPRTHHRFWTDSYEKHWHHKQSVNGIDFQILLCISSIFYFSHRSWQGTLRIHHICTKGKAHHDSPASWVFFLVPTVDFEQTAGYWESWRQECLVNVSIEKLIFHPSFTSHTDHRSWQRSLDKVTFSPETSSFRNRALNPSASCIKNRF